MTTAATTWVDIRTPPLSEGLGLVTAYRGSVVEVGDLDRAAAFYCDLLGLGPRSTVSEGVELSLNARQSLTLVQREKPRVLPESGVHQAYSFPAREIDALVSRLEGAGVEVHRYHEDRTAERRDDRYCSDPDGNRIQLVAGRERGLDHVAVETHDAEWTEVFYTHVLGARVEQRVGWTMEDFARAWEWGNGNDACAPGSRRWDKLYTDDQARVPRSTCQVYFQFAAGVSFGVYLATDHHQEPRRGLFDGTPRTSFWVKHGQFVELERRLHDIRLRCMEPSRLTGGPFERKDDALYVRDSSGNFLEFSESPS